MGMIARAGGLAAGRLAVAAFIALAGCAAVPPTPSPAHVGAEPTPPPQGTIPAPVQTVPFLPPPTPSARPETYSVVVNNVRVQDLLFALARDAKLNVDIHPGITGSVTLNAIDQTLPQLLDRISRQVDMRYELEGQTLTVMRDTPYLRVYRVDYVNLARDASSQANLSTQVSGTTSSGAGGASSGALNNSTATIKSTSVNKFWETLVANIKDLLRETDKIIPVNQPGTAPAAAQPAAPAGGAQPAPATPVAAAPAPQPAVEFREAASVIANPETGVLSIRATARQHEKVQEFLDQVMASAKRQVLIEATIAEVQLNNTYQRGIDWSRLRPTGATSGFTFQQSPTGFPFTFGQNNISNFVIGYASPALNLTAALQLLESFGDVRVLSSPKLTVLNNQTAVLKVVDNLVYFTVQANTTVAANSPAITTFNTTVNSVPVGLIMSVVPQISDSDTVLLNVRPTISRKIGDVADPNPSLANPCGVGVSTCATPAINSLIPVIQTREMESLMRVQSGQTAVLGGLIQDGINNLQDAIPGVRQVPAVGELLSQRKDLSQKTELVIFLRPTVIRTSSMDGDFSKLRELLPGADYFLKPNPGK